MSLRINHNISAINSHRNLIQNTKTQAKNLERLSSGLKINRGADAPAGLIISERLRAQVAGLNQAIDNSEAGISLMQTAEGALEEVNRALINIRQLTVASANEATNDDFMLEANQEEILNSLQLIDRISRIANYGKKAILDGSMGANGITTGDHLEFIEASVDTQTSPVGGYDIMIKEAATRSMIEGSVALSTDIIDREEQITLVEGGKTLNFVTTAGDTVETTMNKLEKALKASGLNIEMLREPGMATEANQPQFLAFRHKEYGSEPSFQVASNTAGLLSANSDVPVLVQNGIDVSGTIGGEFAQGEGQVLTGSEPTKVSGIQIKYTGDVAPEGEFAGTVTIAQNSSVFQIGANHEQSTSFSLRSTGTKRLGKGIENDSGFRSLHEIDVTDTQKALDSMKIVDRAIEEISSFRGDMGAFQKNNLESNLNYLRNAHENLTNAESVIRDADMAEEMTQYARNQIMVQSNTAMLAQANQTPNAVLTLLQGRA